MKRKNKNKEKERYYSEEKDEKERGRIEKEEVKEIEISLWEKEGKFRTRKNNEGNTENEWEKKKIGKKKRR